MAVELANKFALGKQHSMVVFYDRRQIVFLNCTPFCVAIIANNDVNTGAFLSQTLLIRRNLKGTMLNLRAHLAPVLMELAAVLDDVLPSEY